MLDFIGLAVEIGRRSGVISAELFGSIILLITGYKGYVGSKDGTDLILDLKKKLESSEPPEDLKKQVDAMMAMTDALREKTADALDRLEKVIRKTEKVE